MFNLKTIETEYGLESNKRLRSFQLRLHRGPKARFEVPRESAKAAADPPAAAAVCVRTPPTFKLERILVPFDFSAASVRLLSWAISMAERIGARVSVIHVIHHWVPPAGREEPYQFDANGERIETARSLLRRLLDKTCQRVGVLHVHVVIGRPVNRIIQFARCMNSDLIVMATHGEGGLKPLFLSATTEQASRRAPCPVLALPEAVLLRGETAESVVDLTLCRRILVPTDYSADSAAALRYAAALAPQNGSEIHLLNCSEQALPRDITPAHAARFDRDEDLQYEARERLRDWAHSKLQSTKNLKFLICPGNPSAYLLLRGAGLVETDLIILSPRRHVWAERLQRHNKTDAILRNAPCPVLSLRAETRIAGH